MHIRPQIQHPLQGLDDEQVGQSGAVSRGDTDPQPSSRSAFILQRRPLPRALAACLARDQEIIEVFRDPDNRAFDLNSNIGRRPQSYNIGLTVP